MKAKLIVSVFFALFCYSVFSQVPQGLSYQAVARNADNTPIANSTIKVKLSILSDTTGFKATGGGTYIWEEEYTSVQTNQFGQFFLALGTGTRVGGSATAFNLIDWTSGNKFVGVKIANPTTYLNMGTAKLWSVPFAMVADSLSGPVKKLAVTGTTTDYTEALFEVKNKDGQTVFAVYNEGVRIYVDDGIPGKAVKGGFAIGSFNKAKGYSDYFVVTGDSIRAYIDTGIVKARKGGFAIGSFNRAKGYEEYLRVTRDSSRIYINDAASKAVKGGFAIGGFSTAKIIGSKYMTVLPERTNISVNDSLKGFTVTTVQGAGNSDFININKINYSIGHQSGLKTNPNISIIKGRFNVFYGYQSGFNNTEGYGNIFQGYTAGYTNTIGSYNVYMGFRSGYNNISGNSNVFLGYQSGEKSTASSNVFLGQGAGRWNDTGTRNTYVGCQAGIEDGEYGTPGSDNVYLGYRAGATSFIGNQNVYIGSYAGETNNNNSSGRVFIGYQAGRNEANGNRLYIDNTSSATPLIYGEFNATITNRQLTINSKATINGSINYGAESGTATAYVVTIPGITAYTTGMVITFKANNANSGACTLKVNSLSAVNLLMKHDQTPSANYIEAGSIVMAVYDGTSFQMIQPAAN